MLFNTLLVIILSVSGVLCQEGWGVTYTPERICALKGSSVDMSCTYSYPKSRTVQKTFWFIHWNEPQEPEDLSQDPEYSHRVEYLGNKHSDCTFRINQLRESDSAIYLFRFLTNIQDGKYFGQPGVSLTVTGLQVKVTENEEQNVTLTCSSTCTLSGSPTFTWYKNGKVVPYQNEYSLNVASTDDTDLYSCATGGVTSPAVNVKCVKVEITFTTVSEGELVTLTCKITCTYLTGSQTFIWYKNGQYLSHTTQKYQNHDLQFIASSGDAGSYSCAVSGHENLPSPAVTLYPPQSIILSEPSSGEIVEGSSVTLTCSSAANPPVQRYTWYKNNRAVTSETGGPEDSYTIKSITLQDAGQYYCEAGNGIGTKKSPPKRLDVQHPPKSVSVSASPSGEIVEGRSVTLTCSSSYANPAVQRYAWYRNNKAVSSDTGGPEDRYTIKTITLQSYRAKSSWRGSSYTIKGITLQDAVEYYCEAENGIGTGTSPPKRLDVQYHPKSVSVSVRPSGEIVEGSSVTLTCSSDANPPVQNYTWFKKNETVWQAGSGQSLNFSNFRSWNRGQYYCEARNKHGGQNSTAVSINIGGQSRIAAAAVGVAAILALVFLGVVCLRRRKSTNETEGDRQGNKSPIDGNVSGLAMSHTGTQGTDTDDGEVPLYASVQPANTRNQEELLHSTDQKPLPQCEEGVQYASIQIPPSSAAPRSPAASVKEDCVLYSTLRKLDK